MTDIKVGDLIGVDGATGTHGCTNFAVCQIKSIGDIIDTVVIEAQSCHSCWQVGHDQDYVYANVGDTWKFTIDEIMPAKDDWRRDVKWEAIS